MKALIDATQDNYKKGFRAWRTGVELYQTGFQMLNYAKRKFGYTISVPANDWLYDEVHIWLLTTAETQKKKKVRATIAYTGRSARMIGLDDYEESRQVKFFSDDHRTQRVLIDGHKVEVQLLKPDHSNSFGMNVEMAKSLERIEFTCFSDSGRKAVVDLLNKLIAQKSRGDRRPKFNIVSRWGDWHNRSDIAARTKDSVILRKGQAEDLFADLENFLGQEQEYVKRCLPYHRGYLLYGPPGSGKTSIVKALANEFGLDLWYLPLGDISKDTNLLSLISQVDAKSILLLEDVDVFDVAQQRNNDDDDDSSEVSLSGLLNALDGVATPHGLITIMTTNNKDALDDALIRAGRVDRTEFIDYADEYQANELFKFFFSQPPSQRLKVSRDTSCSEILEIFKRHMLDPAEAEAALWRSQLELAA